MFPLPSALFTISPLAKLGAAAVVVAGVFLFGSWKESKGVTAGKAQVQYLWDKEKFETGKVIAALNQKNKTDEENHRVETDKLKAILTAADKLYVANVNNLRSDYAVRLRTAETRAGVYQRQAESGPTTCGSLASYTAELDRSVEEGRSLVRELTTTLRFRDEQLIMLGKQIQLDRALLNTD